MSLLAICGINSPFGELSPTSRQVAHVLLTRLPLDFPSITTEKAPLDLHVLSTPLAFVLSQNQTLRRKCYPVLPGNFYPQPKLQKILLAVQYRSRHSK